MDRYKALGPWINQALVENPDIVKEAKSAVEMYADLYNLWLEDCQKYIKELAVEILENK